MSETIVMTGEVSAVFESYEQPIRSELLQLRALILSTAAETARVGAVSEELRWGQPAYLTTQTRSGSTIRIAPTSARSKHDYAMFFICHTNLVTEFATMFGDKFVYDGTRALLFRVGDPLPTAELRECVAMALTYHLS